MSIWTYLTASPCYTTNTNQHDYTRNIYYKHYKQFISTVSQSSYKYAEASELDLFHGHTGIQNSIIIGKHVIQTCLSKVILRHIFVQIRR